LSKAAVVPTANLVPDGQVAAITKTIEKTTPSRGGGETARSRDPHGKVDFRHKISGHKKEEGGDVHLLSTRPTRVSTSLLSYSFSENAQASSEYYHGRGGKGSYLKANYCAQELGEFPHFLTGGTCEMSNSRRGRLSLIPS